MVEQLQQFFDTAIGTGLWNLILALLILIFGYIVARIIAGVVRRLLKRTELDNRLADAISPAGDRREFAVEDTIASVVFWLLMVFVLVGFFQQLGLSGIAAPFSAFLEQLTTEYLPRLAAAAILLLIGWLVASVLKFLVIKGAQLLKLDERMTKYGALKEEEQVSITEPLATGIFWFVFLLFLPSVLTALGIASIAEPIQQIFNDLFGYIPEVLAAVLLGLIGWFIARIIRQVVTGLLKAIGTDNLGKRVGLTDERSLSEIFGSIIYIIIMIVVVIAALDTLNIAAISEPTTQMLTTIVEAIPGLLGAAVILILAYFIGRFVANLVADLLANIGFNRLPQALGLQWSVERTPSEWVGWLILVVILIFAVTSAVELLGFSFLVSAMDVFVAFLWQVFLAAIIFGFGLYFARLAFRLVAATGINNAHLLARLSQITIIIFAGALALRQLGIADDIVNLAFGITLATIGFAAALAFGLGSREIAGREVDRFLTAMRSPDSDKGTD